MKAPKKSPNEVQIELSEDEFNQDAEFEILTSDKQYDSRYGNFSYSEEDLKEMAKNFNDGVRGVEIAVDLNHDREKKAYAWIKPASMRVGKSAKLSGEYSLYCQLYRYTPEGMELMKTGAYRYFSVEIMLKWQRFKDGAKKAYKNVIFGLALTNSPVIKDMAPTYSGDGNLNTNHNKNMETFKIFLGELIAKEIVTKGEKSTLNRMLSKLSEEEREEVMGEVEKVEQKPEEDEGSQEEDKELAEVRQELSEKDRRLSEVETKLRKKELEEQAEDFILSEKNETGVVRKDKPAVVDFMQSLSEEQIAGFNKVFGLIRSVRLGEAGGNNAEEKDEEQKEKEAEALAEKFLSENPSMEKWEALDKAYTRLGLK